jgi:outer membrane protein TolC
MFMYVTPFKSFALSLLILGSSASAVLAQEAASPPVSTQSNSATPKFFLTLTESIDYAQKNSYEILTAQKKIEDARWQLTETGATGLPQITATASYGRQDPITTERTTDVGGAGGAGLGANPQFAAFLGTASVNTFNAGVTLSQTLFAGFRIVDGVRLANINVGGMEEGLRIARQNVAFQVTNAYFTALRAWETLELDKQNLKLIQEQVRIAEVRLLAGTGVKLDVLQAQSQMIQLQQRISSDLNAYEKAKMSLNQVMGRTSDHPIALNTFAEVKDQNPDEIESLKIAIERRPDLQQLRLQKELNELNATIQARAVWPTLSAQVRYALQDQAVVNGNSNNIQNVNYSLNMNWPIFDGFAAQAKAQRARKSADQVQISLDQLQQRVALDIQQSFMDIEAARERLLMSRAGIQLAEEGLRVSQVSYKEGVGVMLDVVNAQTNLQQASNNLIAARYDINIARARLYQALGLDIVDYLK